MFSAAINKVSKSIFPLFHFGNKGYSVLGTGFFIDNKGHFLTAAHVIDALPPESNIGYLGNIPISIFKEKGTIPVRIIAKNVEKDLALGHIPTDTLPALNLAFNPATLGQSITLCGYPLPMIQLNKRTVDPETKAVNMSLDVTSVRQYWQPTIKMDTFKPDFILKKKFHSFLTQHAALPGMSGGPIFNLQGDVVGLTSAVWPRQIPLKQGPAIQVQNGIGVALEEIKAFLNRVSRTNIA